VCKFYAADTKAMEGKFKMESKEETVASFNALLLNFQFQKINQSDHPSQIYTTHNTGQIYTTHNTEFSTDN
jgi:hypothetical protein